ncbi:MAG TPA: DUF6799 domain-containing protein [Candidatus Binatia bacterium]|nr:DUF6799 domain-containing protein [Candidatus Binatia bacterium]
MNPGRIVLSCLLAGSCLVVSGQDVEMVLNQDGEMITQVGDDLEPMQAAVTFPGGIVIKTNGVFKLGQGKERKLEKGQAITADGMLYKPDGSVGPVFDHYVAKANRIYLLKDGGAPVLVSQNVVFADGSCLRPDAFYSVRGNLRRLIDGQTLGVDGRVIPSLDTVTLKNGTVTVQKEGALLKVSTSMIMNDGTKVLADGTLVSFDGQKTLKLREGETIALPGAVLRQ